MKRWRVIAGAAVVVLAAGFTYPTLVWTGVVGYDRTLTPCKASYERCSDFCAAAQTEGSSVPPGHCNCDEIRDRCRELGFGEHQTRECAEWDAGLKAYLETNTPGGALQMASGSPAAGREKVELAMALASEVPLDERDVVATPEPASPTTSD